MEIKKTEIDALNFTLNLTVVAEDYSDKKKKKMNDYRRKAEIKGFRKGMVPMSLVERMYGHTALFDSVNEVISEALTNYIRENELHIIGEPLPAENQPENDWTDGKDFKFDFDAALYPEVSFELDKAKDSLTQYNIEITDKAKADLKETILKQYGTVQEDKTILPAELNQETYDKVFGEGKVNSEEEFDAQVAQRLEYEYSQESEYRLSRDIRNYLLTKADVSLPEAFLKRWLVAANEGKYTAEDIEKEFTGFVEDFKWQVVKDSLAVKYDIKVEDEDMLSSAKAFASYQYAMYGMKDVPQEYIDRFAKSMLNDEKEGRRIWEQVLEQKVTAAVRENITLKKKKISVEKFRDLDKKDSDKKDSDKKEENKE